MELLGDNWRIVGMFFYEYWFMSPRGIYLLMLGPSGRIGYIAYIGLFGTGKCRLFTGFVFG